MTSPISLASYSGQAVRRSWLLVPASKREWVDAAGSFGADVVVFDLEDLVHATRKQEARANIAAGIASAREGGAEVFVRCDLEALHADLDAAVVRGLQGIVLPKVETAERIAEAVAELEVFEAERGVMQAGLAGEVREFDYPRATENSIELHLSLETAAGIHRTLGLVAASPRVRSVSLGRADLVMDLRPGGHDLPHMPFLMQRLIAMANVARVAPIGAWWQGNSRGLRASPADTLTAARLGRAAGFKGALCVSPDQVAALNHGFTPDAPELDAARACVDAMEAARGRGDPYGRVDGVLVQPALARAARSVLERAAECARRDSIKAAR